MQKYCVCLLVLIATLAVRISHTEAQTLAITPFSITSESGRLDYLDTGIINLFSSRLALPGKVHVVDRAEVIPIFNQLKTSPIKTLIPELAKQTQADFVITGSLSQSAQGIELHVVVLDPQGVKPVLDLKETSGDFDSGDTVIPLVNLIAAKINQKLFSREVPQEIKQKEPDLPYNIHAHPDTLLDYVPTEEEK